MNLLLNKLLLTSKVKFSPNVYCHICKCKTMQLNSFCNHFVLSASKNLTLNVKSTHLLQDQDAFLGELNNLYSRWDFSKLILSRFKILVQFDIVHVF